MTDTILIMEIMKLNPKKVKLTDGKIVLRPYRISDTAHLYQAVRESLAELMPWMPWAHPDYSQKETRQWLKKRPGEWKKGIAYDFAICHAENGTCLGGCGINDIDRTYGKVNLGYWVKTSETGHGVAPAATVLLAEWAFKTLKLNRIEIVVAVDNRRSLRVAEKVGAKKEGILRNRLNIHDKPHDAVMHSLIPGDI